MTGGAGGAFTTTSKLLVALKAGRPLSVTTVTNRFVLEPSPSLGIHVITPLLSIVAPAGGFNNEYVNVGVGMSVSNAVLVTAKCVNGLTVRLLCSPSTGPFRCALTTTVKLLVALRAGVPLSVTTVVNTLVLGTWLTTGLQLMIPLALMEALAGPLTN